MHAFILFRLHLSVHFNCFFSLRYCLIHFQSAGKFVDDCRTRNSIHALLQGRHTRKDSNNKWVSFFFLFCLCLFFFFFLLFHSHDAARVSLDDVNSEWKIDQNIFKIFEIQKRQMHRRCWLWRGNVYVDNVPVFTL